MLRMDIPVASTILELNGGSNKHDEDKYLLSGGVAELVYATALEAVALCIRVQVPSPSPMLF